MSNIYIGLMSGTSMDAIDAAAVCFKDTHFELLGTHSEALPQEIVAVLHSLCSSGPDEINQMGQIDRQLGFLFAKAVLVLLQKFNLRGEWVAAIGSHGQTIRHQPRFSQPFTLQIGDPNVIAETTGITTVADFRRRDMACNGQGAPLTPAFHQYAFQIPQKDRVIVNIGGIANLTYLSANEAKEISGYDIGPGNTLLDQWIKRHLKVDLDNEGAWAKGGEVHLPLLNRLLADAYFKLPIPKSTGREYFNLQWLEKYLSDLEVSPQDVQSTLAELTAQTIRNEVHNLTNEPSEILICGGGIHNQDLIKRLERLKGRHILHSTANYGVDPDWVEAIAFAWLAKQTLDKKSGNVPAVTGATHPTILGGIYLA